MYNFLFDKKSLILLLAGLLTGGGLLFSAGLLIGVQWGLPGGRSVVAAPLAPRQASYSQPCPPAAAPAYQPPAVADVVEEPEPAPEPVVLEQRAALEPSPEPSPEPVPLAEPLAAPIQPAAVTAAYSLQIGAFRQAENSARVVQDLQSRGYDAYVVGERGRLRIVRVGRFADRVEAVRAAADFQRREGMAAIIRQGAGS
jgi:cell division septation protein DedD